jgi:hypothetical protein
MEADVSRSGSSGLIAAMYDMDSCPLGPVGAFSTAPVSA